ncbi:MAG: EAL domain-containing protein [Actinomycetota bacterium]
MDTDNASEPGLTRRRFVAPSGASIRTQLAIVGLLPLLVTMPLAIRALMGDMERWQIAHDELEAAERVATLTAAAQATRQEWFAALDVNRTSRPADSTMAPQIDAERLVDDMSSDGFSRFSEATAAVATAATAAEASLPVVAASKLDDIDAIRADVAAGAATPAEIDLFYSRLVESLDSQIDADLQTVIAATSGRPEAAAEGQAVIGRLASNASSLRHQLTLAIGRLLTGGLANWHAVDTAVDALDESSDQVDELPPEVTAPLVESDTASRVQSVVGDVSDLVDMTPTPRDADLPEAIDAMLAARAELAQVEEPILQIRADLAVSVVDAAEVDRRRAQGALLFSAFMLVAAVIALLLAINRAARAIVNPLRRAASVARRVSEGDMPDAVDTTANGPTEVRDLQVALGELVTTVVAIEAQADALNSGRLNDPALSRRLPGRLGQTLEASLGAWRQTTMRLNHELSHDSLTGVSSRHNLLRQISELGEEEPAALSLFALDRFKEVNDAAGQRIGDEFLCVVASRLNNAVPNHWLVARVGSDEFAVVAPGCDTESMQIAARQLLDVVSSPVALARQTFQRPATVGISSGTNPDTLLAEATIAVRHGKSQGGDQIVPYDDTLAALVAARNAVETELVEALSGDLLELWFQPVLDLESRHVVGAEALIRWPQPDGSMRMPGAFIPVAEETGLILDLDRWVLDSACRTLASWSGTPLADLEIAVNISARHLVDGDLVASVFESCRRWSVDTSRLAIEITESYLAGDLDRTRTILERLHQLGVTLLIDDFGTGYSSLAYLQDLPFDVLKIDRAFVDRMDANDTSRSIVEAMIRLGHTMGLEVLAEGIEADHITEALARLGCDRVQGYAIARPMPLDAFVAHCEEAARQHT